VIVVVLETNSEKNQKYSTKLKKFKFLKNPRNQNKINKSNENSIILNTEHFIDIDNILDIIPIFMNNSLSKACIFCLLQKSGKNICCYTEEITQSTTHNHETN
jgi:Cft2 family RNA processing exonuclease